MKYVALLRGINVGGNSMIRMADLKKAFENEGFKNVVTYINSGNVVFESEGSPEKLAQKLDQSLSKKFGISLRVVVRTENQIKKVLEQIPTQWRDSNNLRCYLAFVKEPTQAKDVIAQMILKEDIDSSKAGEGVVYMTTLLSGLTKSSFSKLAGKKNLSGNYHQKLQYYSENF